MTDHADGPIIDAHAMLGQENHLVLDVDELLRRMDAAGVERAAVRSMGAELAVQCEAGNDRLLSAPDRLSAWASANPWFGERAVDYSALND